MGNAILDSSSTDAAARAYLENVKCLSRYGAFFTGWGLTGLRAAEMARKVSALPRRRSRSPRRVRPIE